MAYSETSSIYKLPFTDGTFICMLNINEAAPDYGYGQHEFIIPNLYMGKIDGIHHAAIKYDSKGNKYEFSENGVVINDTINFYAPDEVSYLNYNPATGKISFTYIGRPMPSGFPTISKTTHTCMGVCYARDTSGTAFNSFGEALAYGERIYSEWTPGSLVDNYYKLESVVKRSKNIPVYGTTIWSGEHAIGTLYPRPLSWFLFALSTGTTGEYDIDINDIIEDFEPEVNPLPEDDPYEPGGGSGDGGGGGDFDDTSEPIDIPALPSVSAADTGFIRLFNPTVAELKSLADFMWNSPLFDLNAYRRLFTDPMDCMLGLSIIPVNVPNGGTVPVKVGNLSTGIGMTVATSQYVEVDCGSINVNEYWGAYLDYDPYTKAEIYLPYIGTHPIAVDDIMKKTVTVKYHVDILSGACTAFIKCGTSVLYQFIGQCSSSIPISASDWTNVINGVLSIAGSIGTMVASGGLSAPVSAGNAAHAIAGAATIASTAINSMKPSIEKSGAMSGTGGMLSVQTPYLILTRPRQALPRSQNSFMGYPSFITENLGALSGYTEIEAVHLSGIPGTDEELSELETLLYKGVIF